MVTLIRCYKDFQERERGNAGGWENEIPQQVLVSPPLVTHIRCVVVIFSLLGNQQYLSLHLTGYFYYMSMYKVMKRRKLKSTQLLVILKTYTEHYCVLWKEKHLER